jgi:hypothetical protein
MARAEPEHHVDFLTLLVVLPPGRFVRRSCVGGEGEHEVELDGDAA